MHFVDKQRKKEYPMKKKKGRPVKDTSTVRSNLAVLVEAKAKRDGRETIPISEIVAETRLATNTVRRYLYGGEGGFDGHSVAVLCKYLECKIEDLLEIVESGGES